MKENNKAKILLSVFSAIFVLILILFIFVSINMLGFGMMARVIGIFSPIIVALIVYGIVLIKKTHDGSTTASANAKNYSSYRTSKEIKDSNEQYQKIDQATNGPNSVDHDYSVETNDNYFNSTSDGTNRVCPLCGAKVSIIDTKCPKCKNEI